MFNLDAAIASWRRSLLTASPLLPDDLDELEQHFREEVGSRIRQGLSEQEAFARTLRQMGDYAQAETEYRKVYWGKVARRGLLLDALRWRLAMLRNYALIAGRTAWRSRGYTAINVAGLAIGLACCIVIFLFVRDESAYDTFHTRGDRIFRVVNEHHGEDGVSHRASTPPAFGPSLATTFPEVVHAVRLYPRRRALLATDDRQFVEELGFAADSTVFDVFSFPLLAGDPATALSKARSIVLTASTAHRLFGERDPVGQVVTFDHHLPLEVTGVMADLPPRSHLRFTYLISFATLSEIVGPEEGWAQWNWQDFYTYVLLAEGVDPHRFEEKIPDWIAANADPHTIPSGVRYVPYLQPLRDIRLQSDGIQLDIAETGSLTAVRAFSLTALFILLIACFNFVNLSTARSSRRALEVGVRKAMGAVRKQLVRQFLSESILLSLLSLGLAVGLAALSLPAFRAFTGSNLSPDLWNEPLLLIGLPVTAVVVGLLAGLYPAVVLAAFRPAIVLKGTAATKRTGPPLLRQALVVTQFVLSIVMIGATLIVFHQLAFLQRVDLGFNRDQVAVLPIRGETMQTGYESFKADLERLPGVVSATASWGIPGQGVAIDGIRFSGRETTFMTRLLLVDFDYLRTFDIHVVAGRGFSRAFPTDASEAYLLNETAARELGWSPDEALGQSLTWQSWGEGAMKDGRIVGVVKDFNIRSLHQPVEPVVLTIYPPTFRRLAVRLRPGDVAATLAAMKRTWDTWAPDWPFEYTFLDEAFDAMYRSERKLGQLFFLFAGLAILIACLGLFGLAAYAVERRKKEIGIRKALGASGTSLLTLLSSEFLRLVLWAFLFATPLTYAAMAYWLDRFAYRIELRGGEFLIAGLAALVVAVFTVGYQALRAARTDPVKTLRYE